jgi:serine protease Do
MQWLKLPLVVLGLMLPGFLQAQLTPADVYRSTSDSVVLILASQGGSQSKGTGSVIAPGQVLTNAHVVLNEDGTPPQKVLVFLRRDNLNDDAKKVYEKGRRARILKASRSLDLALLQVEGLDRVTPIPFGDSTRMQIGDPVLAIGHPENGGLWSLTSGRIGSVIRNHGGVTGRHVLQTETSLNRGNSGGPLLNYNGQIIGVNTSIARKSSDGLAITGVNFSVQSNVAAAWLKQSGFDVATSAPPASSGSALAGIRRTDAPTEVPGPKPIAPRPPAPKPDAPPAPKLETQPLPRPEDGLLTPPQPFRDQDLFQALMDEEEDDFDRLMQQQEDLFDKEMDSAFDSF